MTNRKKGKGWQKLTGGVTCAVALLLVWGGFALVLYGQESPPPAEDHLAIAARYRQEAAAAREAVERHQLALAVYRQGTEKPYTVMNPQGRQQMVRHCERLIAHYTEAAKELDAMAAEHEALAEQLQGMPPK